MLCSLILSLSLLSSSARAAEWPALEAVQLPRSTEGRSDAAVIVAIEDYMDVDDVPGARANAEGWFRYLQARGVPPSRIFQALDREAKDLQIKALAERAAGAVQPGGTLWFVFIGHGAATKDGRDALLVGVDADRSEQGIYQRSVPRTELLALLETGKQAQTVALLDACFSGQSASGQALVAGLQPLIPTALAKTAPSARTRVLTAAGSGEFAGPLSGASRPAFSYLALGGLLGWADVDGVGDQDGSVTASELREYVAGALNTTVRGRTQTPTLLGEDAPLAKVMEKKAPDLLAFVRAPAPPAASASAPAPTGAVTGTSFGAPTLDVSAQIQEQKCLDEARSKLAKLREQELSKAASRVLAEGRAAWQALAPQAEACTQLPDPGTRQSCIAALDSWLATARGANVSLPATSEPQPTACGPRTAADEARRASVDLSAEIAAAGKLRRRLEETKPSAPERPAAGTGSATPGESPCADLVRVEPAAMMGQLRPEQAQCLEARLSAETQISKRDKLSRLLIVNADAAGDKPEWVRLLRRHLEDIDRSDPDMCFRYALQLSRGGAKTATETVRWADAALEQKGKWSGSNYKTRVFSLHKLRAEATQKEWADARAYLPAERVGTLRVRAAAYAKAWLDYARASGQDTKKPLEMCVALHEGDERACRP